MKVEKVMINGKGYYHYRHCEKIMANLCMRCCFLKDREGGGHRCALPFKCEPDGYYILYNEKPIEIGDAKFVIDVPPPPELGEADKETGGKAAAQQRPTEPDGRSGQKAGRTGGQKNETKRKDGGKNMNRYGKRKDGARL